MKKIFWLFIFFPLFGSSLFAREFHFIRTPALSPDGSLIAFSYQGDIWTVSASGGRASRLTVHPEYDWNPRFSPDGKTIAFHSTRSGNSDIYVMTAEGDRVRRLTYFSGIDLLMDWSPDGKKILFLSQREISHLGRILYEVPLEGGTPTPLLKMRPKRVSMSHQGDRIALSLGNDRGLRKNYRGSGNNDLYIYSLKGQSLEKITDFSGRDESPLWSKNDEFLYFLSDRDGLDNLWAYDFKEKKFSQLTFFKKDGIRSASISFQGEKIVLEVGLDVWTYEIASKNLFQVKIHGPEDEKENLSMTKIYTSQAESFDLSPDGSTLAFVVGGDLFVLDAQKGGKARNLSQTPWREKTVSWSRDGKKLFFASNQTGKDQIYSIEPGDGKSFLKALHWKISQVISLPQRAFSPRQSPDGKKIAFIQERGNLAVMDSDGKNFRILQPGFLPPSFSWSPDSNYLAVSQEDSDFNSDVWIVSARKEDPFSQRLPFNLSRHPDHDQNPVWSPNGRFIAFVSRRNKNTSDIWIAYLHQEDYEKNKEEWQEYLSPKNKEISSLEENSEEEEASVWFCPKHPQKSYSKPGKCPLCEARLKRRKKKIVPEKKVSAGELIIDWEGLPERVRQLTNYLGEEEYISFSPDSKTILFKSNSDQKSDLFSVKVDGSKVTRLTDGNYKPRQSIFASGDKIFFRSSTGSFYSFSLKTPSVKPLSFQAKVEFHLPSLRHYTFQEAFDQIEEHFYDPKFHGVDWKAQYEKYKTWVPHVSTQEDFYILIQIMLGELNASHLGIYPPLSGKDTSGMLGVRMEWDSSSWKVSSVIPRSPASRKNSHLEKGDKLLKIRGKYLQEKSNLYQFLENTLGEEIPLTIERDGKEMELIIQPASYNEIRKDLYLEWVERNRAFVEKMSQGKLGYVHIQSMGWESVEKFEQELFSSAYQKEGLIIDVRYNGGGWTTDYLLTILMVKRHAITLPRGGKPGYPQDRLPYYAWTKPALVLCNEYSFSNAEIFSHAFKTLKRGTLVGKTTFGGVISTGSATLLDGSKLRIPARGWYIAGSGKNMENSGAVPDIEVENLPGEEIGGRDHQLEKAVEVLLGQCQKEAGEKKK